MREKPILKVSVVGRNLSAAAWLRSALETPHAPAEFSWHQADQECALQKSSMWVLVPDSFRAEMSVPALRAGDPVVFLAGSRRVLAKDFLGDQATGWVPTPIPLAVRKKFIAAGLFSDLTPHLWRKNLWGGLEPDSHWTDHSPESLPATSLDDLWLVPRDLALAAIEKNLAAQGVTVMHGDCGVHGIERIGRGQGHHLQHNAPFGITTSDKTVWSAPAALFPHETSEKSQRRLEQLLSRPVGRWMSFGASVPARHVTALPNLSLWIDPVAAEEFYRTGVLRSRALKRVFCLEAALLGGPAHERWLQIEELEFDAAKERDPLTVHTGAAFLHEICPGLKEFPADYIEEKLTENHLFSTPGGRFAKMAEGVDFWYRGWMGSPARDAAQWIKKNLPPPRKKEMSP